MCTSLRVKDAHGDICPPAADSPLFSETAIERMQQEQKIKDLQAELDQANEQIRNLLAERAQYRDQCHG